MGNGLAYALSAFKAYDIRGRVPQELDELVAERLGMAFAKVTRAHKVVVGYDIRLTSPSLADAVCSGLNKFGADVVNIGLSGTEEVYYACGALGFEGGIMVTASHNPKEYNGFKMVLGGARPICQDNGLSEIRRLVTEDWDFNSEIISLLPSGSGRTVKRDIHDQFIDFILGLVNLETFYKNKLTVAVNCGNGGAGIIVNRLAEKLPIELHIFQDQPDGNFPNGIPNPLLPENRQSTSKAVLCCHADLGAAWDGDFDRCFFFDECGQFIEGYYLVGLFAKYFLDKYPGASIIYDPRLYWNTKEIVLQANGLPVMSKTGHAFIKQAMRCHNSVYGGEMSAHQYFKEFFYCG
ncbi:MAG: phosphomannomutase/phosphoglucomutase [Candidatus Bruticola sp.]